MVVNARNGLLKTEGKWINHSLNHPFQILILNLMPTKLDTEKQFLNRLNSFDTNLEVTFMYPATHHFKTTNGKSIQNNYVDLSQIQDRYYDGMIITGSPLEYVPYEKIDFWQELNQITAWSKNHVRETLSECWAANAQLFINFKIKSYLLKQKIFGIYQPDEVLNDDRLASKVNPKSFWMPQSRNSQLDLDENDLPDDLEVIATNKEVGPMILHSDNLHHTFVTGHPEYGPDTLCSEYQRDIQKNLPIQKPKNYFDKNNQIVYSWATSSQRFYRNWINLVKSEALIYG